MLDVATNMSEAEVIRLIGEVFALVVGLIGGAKWMVGRIISYLKGQKIEVEARQTTLHNETQAQLVGINARLDKVNGNIATARTEREELRERMAHAEGRLEQLDIDQGR